MTTLDTQDFLESEQEGDEFELFVEEGWDKSVRKRCPISRLPSGKMALFYREQHKYLRAGETWLCRVSSVRDRFCFVNPVRRIEGGGGGLDIAGVDVDYISETLNERKRSLVHQKETLEERLRSIDDEQDGIQSDLAGIEVELARVEEACDSLGGCSTGVSLGELPGDDDYWDERTDIAREDGEMPEGFVFEEE